MNKKLARLRRARKTRIKIAIQGVKRLVVYKSNCNIYAQIFDETGSSVLASASSLDKTVTAKNGGNIEAAAIIGKMIAERAVKLGITSVAFDRSGFQFHGRIKALADAARANGLVF